MGILGIGGKRGSKGKGICSDGVNLSSSGLFGAGVGGGGEGSRSRYAFLDDTDEGDDEGINAYSRLLNGPEDPRANTMSAYQHQHQNQQDQQSPLPAVAASTQQQQKVFNAYDHHRNTTCYSSWLQTIAVGLGAIAALYYPVVDMDVLEEATAADAIASHGAVKATGRFIHSDDIDAVLLEDLSFRQRR